MYKRYIKRVLDFMFALILIPIILPVIVICGLLIFIEDRGNIFYLGERLGKDKKTFKMYKLRTMKMNAPDIRNEDGSTFNSDNDSRLTKIGKLLRKTSLDELPQVINVLIGDMSFIGPRPDLPEHINYYKDDDIRKLEVLPGISGYNQAYYRNSTVWGNRLKNDVYYVDNISIWLDIKILFKTIEGIVLKKGIYGTTQLSNFKGDEGSGRSYEA